MCIIWNRLTLLVYYTVGNFHGCNMKLSSQTPGYFNRCVWKFVSLPFTANLWCIFRTGTRWTDKNNCQRENALLMPVLDWCNSYGMLLYNSRAWLSLENRSGFCGPVCREVEWWMILLNEKSPISPPSVTFLTDQTADNTLMIYSVTLIKKFVWNRFNLQKRAPGK